MVVLTLKALVPFRDKVDHTTTYPKGGTIEISDLERVNDMVSRGIAKIVNVSVKADGEAKKAAMDTGNAGTETANGAKQVAFQGTLYDLQTVKDALISIGIAMAPNVGVNGISNKIAALTDEQATELASKLSVNKD